MPSVNFADICELIFFTLNTVLYNQLTFVVSHLKTAARVWYVMETKLTFMLSDLNSCISITFIFSLCYLMLQSVHLLLILRCVVTDQTDTEIVYKPA
jgi:hypothetical protein